MAHFKKPMNFMNFPNCSLLSLERLVPQEVQSQYQKQGGPCHSWPSQEGAQLLPLPQPQHIKITISHPECDDKNKPVTKNK
jgi:hypothetical protein